MRDSNSDHWSREDWHDWQVQNEDDFGEERRARAAEDSGGSAGWLCELIADRCFPDAQLDRTELAMDVNYCFQSFGGLRKLPRLVSASDFGDRWLTRANDPKQLQVAWSFGRRLYWSVYDVAPTFWQQQFHDRSLAARVLVRMIAVIVAVNPQKSLSSQKLIALVHTPSSCSFTHP